MAAHRYWRVRAATTYASGFFGIAELAFRETSGGSNLLIGKTLSASATLGGFPTSNVVDGNASTFWTTGGNSPPMGGHWFAVDLGSGNEAEIVEVVLQVRPDGFREDPNSLFLDYSDNGTDWTADGESTQGTWTAGESRTITFTPVPPASARLSQSGVEVARTGTPPVILSQSGVEVARTGTPPIILSQSGVEVAYVINATPARRRQMVICN